MICCKILFNGSSNGTLNMQTCNSAMEAEAGVRVVLLPLFAKQSGLTQLTRPGLITYCDVEN